MKTTPILFVLALCPLLLPIAGCTCRDACAEGNLLQANREKAAQAQPVALITDDLKHFEPVQFGGEGEVSVKDGVLNLDMGTMTGVRYTGDITKLFGENLENYEITLDAKRVEGLDIFLGLTFPVGKAGHVSLVLGGWGGVVNGISNLDGGNASENKTTTFQDGGFEPNQWYKVRVRVTDEQIACWLDAKQIVDVKRADYSEYDTHSMVVDSKPFGLFTYETWGAYKDLKVRKLD